MNAIDSLNVYVAVVERPGARPQYGRVHAPSAARAREFAGECFGCRPEQVELFVPEESGSDDTSE